jgi:hypothetical protein
MTGFLGFVGNGPAARYEASTAPGAAWDGISRRTRPRGGWCMALDGLGAEGERAGLNSAHGRERIPQTGIRA